ncbi:MAG: tryptophan synthase subunit alpha, partial [Cyanobacteria bacterium J06553_1]
MPQESSSRPLSNRQNPDWQNPDWQSASTPDWQSASTKVPPESWVKTVEHLSKLPTPKWGAQLLWARGLRSADSLKGFLRAADYEPASPFGFGEEMTLAVERLVLARAQAEKIAIWGDFDADGVTSTAVLWDGLRQFFPKPDRLIYFIPNRLKESHGLSTRGIHIQAAATRSLKKGTTLDAVLGLVKDVSPKLSAPIILFTYYNPVLNRGVETFLKDIYEAGARGLVVPDLPLEEMDTLLTAAEKIG